MCVMWFYAMLCATLIILRPVNMFYWIYRRFRFRMCAAEISLSIRQVCSMTTAQSSPLLFLVRPHESPRFSAQAVTPSLKEWLYRDIPTHTLSCAEIFGHKPLLRGRLSFRRIL